MRKRSKEWDNELRVLCDAAERLRDNEYFQIYKASLEELNNMSKGLQFEPEVYTNGKANAFECGVQFGLGSAMATAELKHEDLPDE